jgi:hypothetical protein
MNLHRSGQGFNRLCKVPGGHFVSVSREEAQRYSESCHISEMCVLNPRQLGGTMATIRQCVSSVCDFYRLGWDLHFTNSAVLRPAVI